MGEIKEGLVWPYGLLLLFTVPILLEPDYGTTLLFATIGILLMVIAGCRWMPLISMAAVGFMGVAILIFNNPERMARIMAFLYPQLHEQGKAWQLANSLRAFASGGLWGVGFGNSFQIYHYLPEAHTDFILPIIGEELGWVASLIVTFLYLILFLVGMKVALSASDDFGKLLAHGIILMLVIQALINFVGYRMRPDEGISASVYHGGSSILASSTMGILINIASGRRSRGWRAAVISGSLGEHMDGYELLDSGRA